MNRHDEPRPGRMEMIQHGLPSHAITTQTGSFCLEKRGIRIYSPVE
jgi:hypothetical protein